MEFRLVRILPAKMSTIKCEIFAASLLHPPRYTAISYAWGDKYDTRKIQLEGATIPVAASLHGALGALREKSEPVTVWIDYLCIDVRLNTLLCMYLLMQTSNKTTRNGTSKSNS
jgi:hypothetical protein